MGRAESCRAPVDYRHSVGIAQLEHLKVTVRRMLKTGPITPTQPQARRDALFPRLSFSNLEDLNVGQRVRLRFSPGCSLHREGARLGAPGRVEWMTVLSIR
jgi:hypothetical protein